MIDEADDDDESVIKQKYKELVLDFKEVDPSQETDQKDEDKNKNEKNYLDSNT